MISQERVKQLLSYDPETGIFVRLKSCKGKVGRITTNGYMDIGLDYKRYQAHCIAWVYMTGEYPVLDIDHINHIRTDNRFINLRQVTRTENMKNSKRSKANSSGFTGVYWDTTNQKWSSQIVVNGKQKSLGRFFCKIEAIAARIRANKEYGFHENHGVS